MCALEKRSIHIYMYNILLHWREGIFILHCCECTQFEGGAAELLDTMERYSLYLSLSEDDVKSRRVKQKDNAGKRGRAF